MPHLHGACGGEKELHNTGVPSVPKGLVPQGLHPGRSHSRSPGPQQVLSSMRALLTLLLFALQGQALRAGVLSFQCPLCRDDDEFAPQMVLMGIRIPFRLVSFCLAHNTGGGSCCARPCPRSPGPALSCESGLQLHTRLAKALEAEQGQPVPPGWQSSTSSSVFPFPIRQPTWEDNDAFAELGERHSWCNARKCLYPRGREEAEEEG